MRNNFCSFYVLMLLITSSWKKLFNIYFFIVFFNNARGNFPPQWQIPRWKVPPTYPPLLNPSPNQNILLKTPAHFPITITIFKHWSKFVTCSPSHGDCGGVSRPQRHSYKFFRLRWIKWLSQNFDPLTLGKKIAWEGA